VVVTDTELPDHGNVAAFRRGSHGGPGARNHNSARVIDEFVLRHADAGIVADKGFVFSGVVLTKKGFGGASITPGSAMGSYWVLFSASEARE